MTIRTILGATSGGTASQGAIELACRLARRFGAHLEGFHVRVDPYAVFAAAGEDFVSTGELFESIVAEGAATAAATQAAFAAATAGHEIPHRAMPQFAAPHEHRPSACWREETGYAPALVPARARFFDLVVLGRSGRVVSAPYTDTIEQTLARSGRPVLLAPADPPPGIGDRVALAWNGSPQAVRSVVAALPFLEKAGKVSVITVGDRDTGGGLSLVDHLAWHGIAAAHRHLPPGGANIGEKLLAAAAADAADLLVMGGYGHAPWREYVLGGATREVVGASLIPLLLAH